LIGTCNVARDISRLFIGRFINRLVGEIAASVCQISVWLGRALLLATFTEIWPGSRP
jgi:hypothetical protein